MKIKALLLASLAAILLTACPHRGPNLPPGSFFCSVDAQGQMQQAVGTASVGTTVRAKYRLVFNPLTNESGTPGQGKYSADTINSPFSLSFSDADQSSIEGQTGKTFTHNNQPLGDAIAFVSSEHDGDLGGVTISSRNGRVELDIRDRGGNVLSNHELDKITADWDDFPTKAIIIRDGGGMPITDIKLSEIKSDCRYVR